MSGSDFGQPGAHLFETTLGPCGIAWTKRGIDRLQLPEASVERAAARLSEAVGRRPVLRRAPAAVAPVVQRIQRHFRRRPDPLRDVPVDLAAVSPFARRVYTTLRAVEPGEVVTYGELARRVGRSGAAQAVGRAMGANPVPLIIPCHRVVGSNGELGGFSAAGGPRLKATMLFAEGYVLDPRHAEGMQALRRADPRLRPIIDRVGPYLPRVGRSRDPYDALVDAIIYQQLSIKAAAAIAARVRALTPGRRHPRPVELLGLSDRALKLAGLSKQKLGYLRGLATRIASGELRLGCLGRMDDEAVIDALTRVRGLGRWSAQMVLIFHLDRLDVLPVDDLGLRIAAGRIYGLGRVPPPAALERLGERWRPFRSMASWYLWQSRRLPGA